MPARVMDACEGRDVTLLAKGIEMLAYRKGKVISSDENIEEADSLLYDAFNRANDAASAVERHREKDVSLRSEGELHEIHTYILQTIGRIGEARRALDTQR